MNIYAAIIAVYVVLIVLLSLLTRKVASRSASEFLIAGRQMGLGVCAVVVAAEWLGGMSTIGVSETAFLTGTLQPILYNLSTAAGMIIIGFTVAAEYRKREVHTVSEMIESLFSKRVRSISAVGFLVAYIVLAYVQLQTCAGVLAPLFGISWTTAVVVSAVLITGYTYLGGMHALAITGVLYLITMFLGLGAAFVIGLVKIGGFSALHADLVAGGAPAMPFNPFSGGVGDAFGLLVGGILGGMAAQASIQPIFGARNVRTAKRAAVLAALIVAPFGIMTAFLGLIARTGRFLDVSLLVDAKTALPSLLATPEFIHPWLGGIALAGILAAILSTVGPINFAVVTIAAKDIYHDRINPAASDERVVAVARKLVVLVSLITLPLAIFLRGAVLNMAYISYAIRAIGAIVVALGLYRRRWITRSGVEYAFIFGLFSIFFCMLASQQGWFHIDKTFGAIGATVVGILLGHAKDRLRPPATPEWKA